MREIVVSANGETTWIACPGCSGEIGVPPDWPAEVVCCPKCAAVVSIDERTRVLWRPSNQPAVDLSGDQATLLVRWLPCHACGGEIGVPPSWYGPTIACPKCGAIAAIEESSRALWRPPAENPTAASRVHGHEAEPGGLWRSADAVPQAWQTRAYGFDAERDGDRRQAQHWSRHGWYMGLIFLGLIVVVGIALLSAPTHHEREGIVVLLLTGWCIPAIIGLGCWWNLLMRLCERGHTLVAVAAFLTLPVSYLVMLPYGWTRLRELKAERTMLVWTYSFAVAFYLIGLGVACISFGVVK